MKNINLKNSSLNSFISAGLHLLTLILWFVGGVKVSAGWYGESYSMHEFFRMEDSISFLSTATIAVLAIGIVCSLLAALTGGKKLLTVSKIAAGWTVAVFVIVLISVIYANATTSGADGGLTLGGWLIGILSVTNLVMQIVGTRKKTR